MNSDLFRKETRNRAPVWRVLPAALALATLLAGCHSKQDAASGGHEEGGAHLITVGGNSGLALDEAGRKLAGVTVETADISDLSPSVQPTGEVAPTDVGTVQVTSRLPGKITQARVGVGAHVHQGDMIATVDSVDLAQAEATYRTADAHARLAYNQLIQQRKMAGFGTISEQPIEDARKALSAAEAAVSSDEAQIALDKLTLENTRQLVDLGEITRKPVEDAQNAYAQAQAALAQAKVNLHSTKANLDRATILFNGGVFSKQQFEDAETANNNAIASQDQATTQEKLASEELKRQQAIYSKNLNGASALQQAQSKLQQDQHTYASDLTAQELARKQLARAQVVYKSGIPVSQALQSAQDNYDEAEVALQGAIAALRLYGVSPSTSVAQMANGHVVIPVVSPIDGIVTARNMVVGQITDISTPLVKVVNLDRVFVDAQVYEKDIAGIRMGDPVKLQVAAFPTRTFHGQVTYIANEVNPDTRTLTVRTEVENPGWLLRPSMYATVLIGSRNTTRALSIPADAVLQEGTHQIVYVETSPGQYVQHTITVGTAVSGRVPVRSGLSAGDRVVVTGCVLLQQEQDKLQSEEKGAK
ncbi:MAG TPA: efflux RND transporter periplasmic adaptor subunit [Chthonomonadaceae bacterium]|nr:efflux RND transporter periplasmic adaptor subunit [Chthonomonadaceae bacterium]